MVFVNKLLDGSDCVEYFRERECQVLLEKKEAIKESTLF